MSYDRDVAAVQAHGYLLMVTGPGGGQNNDTLETLSGETAKELYFAESVQK